MKIARAFALSLAVALALCAPAVAGPGGAAPSLTILTPTLDLGSVVPEQAAVSLAQMNVVVNAASGWQLALAREAPRTATALGFRARSAAEAPASGDLSVQVGQGQWAPLVAGTVTPLVSGGPTGPNGSALSFEFMVATTLDSAPGQRDVGLHFVLNGQPVTPSVQVSFDVAALIGLTSDSRPFQISASIDPTKTGTYPLDSRFFTVSGNTPWVLEVSFKDRLTDAKSPRTLGDGAIVILFPTGAPQALLPGSSVVIDTGPAVGRAGRQVELRLAVVIQGNEIAGQYSADLVAVARIADPSSPVSSGGARSSARGLHAAVELAGSGGPPGLIGASAGPMRWSLAGRVEDALRWR